MRGPNESAQAAEAAVEAIIAECRDLDPATGAAHAIAVAVPALGELGPGRRAVWSGELLGAAMGLESEELRVALAEWDRLHGRRAHAGDDAESRIVAEMELVRTRREARRRLDAEERGLGQVPEGITLRELTAEPDDVEDYRIGRLQPADSRVLFAAQTTAGKTTVVGNLIRSLLDGDPFVGRYATKPISGKLALLDFEMSRRQLREWLRAQRIAADDRLIVFSMRGNAAAFDIMAEPIRQQWAERLRSFGVTYVILDCLRPCLDAFGLDENHDAGVFLVAFDALLGAAGIPDAVVVHHFGHNHERSRGDSRIRDWCDVEWTLVRQGDEPDSARYFRAFGRDVDEPEQRLVFDPTTRRLTILGGSRKEAAATGALGAVLVALAEVDAPLTTTAIVEALADSEHSRAAIRDGLRAGIRDGSIATESGPRRAILHRLSSPPAHSISEPVAGEADSAQSAGITGALKPATDKALPATNPSVPECAASAPEQSVVSAPKPIGGWRTDDTPESRKDDPDRFSGLDWRQQRAARLREIQGRDDWIGDA